MRRGKRFGLLMAQNNPMHTYSMVHRTLYAGYKKRRVGCKLEGSREGIEATT